MSIEAMKQALEALEELQGLCSEESAFIEQVTIWTPEAITSLRQAIAEAEKQEPVAEYIGNNPQEMDLSKRIGLIRKLTFIPLRSKLYTHPPKREWIGLTDEDELDWDGGDLKSLITAVEAKLKEKNT
jgi:hypothetical protein